MRQDHREALEWLWEHLVDTSRCLYDSTVLPNSGPSFGDRMGAATKLVARVLDEDREDAEREAKRGSEL